MKRRGVVVRRSVLGSSSKMSECTHDQLQPRFKRRSAAQARGRERERVVEGPVGARERSRKEEKALVSGSSVEALDGISNEPMDSV